MAAAVEAGTVQYIPYFVHPKGAVEPGLLLEITVNGKTLSVPLSPEGTHSQTLPLVCDGHKFTSLHCARAHEISIVARKESQSQQSQESDDYALYVPNEGPVFSKKAIGVSTKITDLGARNYMRISIEHGDIHVHCYGLDSVDDPNRPTEFEDTALYMVI